MRHPDQDARLDLDPNAQVSPAALELQDDLEGDTLREECGVFGIYGHPDAAAITALGLHALQHRGQEAAGIVAYDGSRFHSERRLCSGVQLPTQRPSSERTRRSIRRNHSSYRPPRRLVRSLLSKPNRFRSFSHRAQ